jgi:regulatory protein
MIFKKALSPEQALQKAKHYCRYQQRSHSEVKQKLYSLALKKKDVDELLAQLIEEKYLNEEEFAIAFARGKFRMKQWGKVKIKYELKLKKVSDYCIKKALKEIDENDYRQTLEKLARERLESLKTEKNIFIKKRKLQDFLFQKGYENELVKAIVAMA